MWPYHDHSRAMHESIEGGMYGALSILGRHERRADREFVVFFNSMHDFETINNRAFIRNTPTFRSRVGDVVQWDVLALGSAHHTFHVHGHRWRGPTRSRSTRARSDRRRASGCAGSSASRGRGCITATARTTWSAA